MFRGLCTININLTDNKINDRENKEIFDAKITEVKNEIHTVSRTVSGIKKGEDAPFFATAGGNRIYRLGDFFLKSFSLVSEFVFYNYFNKDKTVNNKYNFLSASLSYQKTKYSKLEYKIGVINLLNTKSLNDNNFNQNAISN